MPRFPLLSKYKTLNTTTIWCNSIDTIPSYTCILIIFLNKKASVKVPYPIPVQALDTTAISCYFINTIPSYSCLLNALLNKRSQCRGSPSSPSISIEQDYYLMYKSIMYMYLIKETSFKVHLRVYLLTVTRCFFIPSKHTTSQQRRCATTSLQRRYNVVTLQRRYNDVILTLCVCCVSNSTVLFTTDQIALKGSFFEVSFFSKLVQKR